jgi:hypothetical protein
LTSRHRFDCPARDTTSQLHEGAPKRLSLSFHLPGEAFMRKCLLLLSLSLIVFRSIALVAQETQPPVMQTPPLRGADLFLGAKENQRPRNLTSLYQNSYALIIGISEYEHWDDLKGVVEDVGEVEQLLKKHGFEVEIAVEDDLKSERLAALVKDFIIRRGVLEENRLLIYYAGHGYKEPDKDVGFIIPKDAPQPADKTFREKAISMSVVRSLAERIASKHALFIFDSCFSGSMINAAETNSAKLSFNQTNTNADVVSHDAFVHGRGGVADTLPFIPRSISYKASLRTRQFIASGTDKQLVPDNSDFRKRFVLGLTDESGQGADSNADGFVTGKELGDYLQMQVTNKSDGRQNPTWGFIGTQAANQGDFIFIMPGASAREEVVTPQTETGIWQLPQGWLATENRSFIANGPGLMLPKDGIRYSYRDFEFITRLTLTKNTSAKLIVRAQTPQDYYLIEFNGGSHPNRDKRLTLQAYTVLAGVRKPIEKAEPQPLSHPILKEALNHEKELQIKITGERNILKVDIVATSGKESGRSILRLKFTDEKRTFAYGAPGFLLEEPEVLRISSISISKIERMEKGVD